LRDTLAEMRDKTADFDPYHHWDNTRIQRDFNLLVSDVVQARMGVVVGDTQQAVDDLLEELDAIHYNEFGFELHDFELIYNYFSRPDYLYGQRPIEEPYNVLFSLDYPDTQQNHVDFYLAGFGAELPSDLEEYIGISPSHFWDEDEDSTEADYLFNSLQGYDGPKGLEIGNPDWYKSGGACNLRFNHEYQHICYISNRGLKETGWPNEMFSTAAEYLSGVSTGSGFWEPIYDIPCDANLTSITWGDPCHDISNPYGMWRLFAAYLLHQFNTEESDYTDDLLYKWLTNWPSYGSVGVSYPGLYCLGRELESPPWDARLQGAYGLPKLHTLFRDWSIAKAVNDSTLNPPWGDDVTLGFKRGVSPYYDVGLFRDMDQSCCALNSTVLPHEHPVVDTVLNKFVWVTSYTDPSDIALGDCVGCACDPNKDDTLTVSEKADPIGLRTWGSDYILFESDEYFETGGPYDLKIQIRGENPDPPSNNPADMTEIQATVLTYSSADSVFRSSDGLREIRMVDINPDSAKANITVCGFGDSVKAVLVVVGLVPDVWPGQGPHHIAPSVLDMFDLWDYKYGYTVEKHWKSGPIPWSVAWFDSIHVNGDLTVPPDRALTIEPGTRVEFFPVDTLHSGVASDRSELILSNGSPASPGGKLLAEGAASETVLFTSGASTKASGDWYGVRVLEGSSTFAPKYCTFEYAAYPILCTGDTVDVDRCIVRNFNIAGIYAGDGYVTVDTSEIDMSSGGQYGIELVGSSTGSITGNTIEGAGGGAAGVGMATGSTATLSHNTITGMYTGIEADSGVLTSSYDEVSGFQYAGIKASGSTVAVSHDALDIGSTGVTGIELIDCPSGDVSHNVITGSSSGVRYGIKCSGSTSASVSYNTLEDVCIGLSGSGTSDVDITNNIFTDNSSSGVSGEGSSSLDVKGNSITGYAYYGVTIKNTATADLGAQPDSGSNRIFTESTWTDYCVMNKTASTVMAEYNWWGTSQPTQSLFYGPVDWDPYLAGDPGLPFGLKMPGRPLATPAVAYTVQNYPNPLNPVTAIEYGVPEDGAKVTIRVFDVSGRVVRVLVDEARPAGVHVVTWDGSGEDGRRVASGVYLYEAVIGKYRVTKKMVVLR
jgi:hypothetical protein